jgi:hypothetical protein
LSLNRLSQNLGQLQAAPEELLEKLLDAPRMRGHLSRIGMKL